MKIDNLTLQYMTNDIKVIIKHCNIDVKQLDVNQLNNLWFHTYCNRTYLDNNPNVIKDNNGNRLLSYISREKYDLYPCNTNDTTIYTGLKQILINLQK
jgi:hypothetical protein